MRGMVIKRDTEGAVKRAERAKVAVFAQGIDTHATETKVRPPPPPPRARARPGCKPVWWSGAGCSVQRGRCWKAVRRGCIVGCRARC